MKMMTRSRALAYLGLVLVWAVSWGQDSTEARGSAIVSRDSAVITTPRPLTVLGAIPVVEYAVEPLCPVSRVDLLVRYFPGKTDVLAFRIHPPFTARWNIAAIPDQDQVHLQFGYRLFHTAGDTIMSPPMPHQWVIRRNVRASRRRYRCHETRLDGEITVDGDLGDWRGFPGSEVGDKARFGCCWTSTDIFVGVEVRDGNVTCSDRVEVCFDLKQTRTPFFGIDHRIVSLAPLGKSFIWVVHLSDTGAAVSDSVIIRFEEEAEWRTRQTPDGYVVEARVPFCILSNLEFPRKRFGFDVAVVSHDSSSGGDGSISWAGAQPSSRYSPSEWGTVSIHQVMLPLKVMLVGVLLCLGAIVGLIGVIAARAARRERDRRRQEVQGPSPRVLAALTLMGERMSEPGLRVGDIAAAVGCGSVELADAFEAELGVSLDRKLTIVRMSKAKELLRESDTTAREVAEKVGFADPRQFAVDFAELAGMPPEEWREVRQREVEDEEACDGAGGSSER